MYHPTPHWRGPSLLHRGGPRRLFTPASASSSAPAPYVLLKRVRSTTSARWSVFPRSRKRLLFAEKSRDTRTWSIWAPRGGAVMAGQLGVAGVAGEAGGVPEAGVQDAAEDRVVLGGVEVAREDGGPGAVRGRVVAQVGQLLAPGGQVGRERRHRMGELEPDLVAPHVGRGAGHAHGGGDARGRLEGMAAEDHRTVGARAFDRLPIGIGALAHGTAPTVLRVPSAFLAPLVPVSSRRPASASPRTCTRIPGRRRGRGAGP